MTTTNRRVPNGRQHDEPSPGWSATTLTVAEEIDENEALRNALTLAYRLKRERESLTKDIDRLRRERESLLKALREEREIRLKLQMKAGTLPPRHTHPRLG